MANALSPSAKQAWSKFLVKNFDAASVMVPLVNRSVEPDLANAGARLTWPSTAT
ncbi:MAG: hypothetical protein R2857_14415 [Vampirovibrionales bacterium]